MKEQQELVSLEVLVFNKDISKMNEEEIKNEYRSFKEEFTIIDDLSQPYVIRTVVGNHADIKSLEPDMIPECDRFEISESIQELLKEQKVPVYKSDFDQQNISNIAKIKEDQLNNAIKHEMIKGIKEIQKKADESSIDKNTIDKITIDTLENTLDKKEDIDEDDSFKAKG